MFLEYCPNGDLKSYLKKNNNKLKVTEAIKYSNILFKIKDFFKIQLADSKYYTKIKSSTGNNFNIKNYRDIKPANIMIKQGNCMITDFGFARCLEEVDMEK